jgi:succinylarginine dihydrolase
MHSDGPRIFPARQTREASEAVARLHDIPHDRRFFLKQNPDIIDKGIFHNDVISVSNERVLLYHEIAFENRNKTLLEIQGRFEALCNAKLITLEVRAGELRPEEAVATYLFNSQLITLPDGGMALIAPRECEHHTGAHAVIDRILADPANPVHTVHYVAIRQSMENGGGPACLRLRVVLTEEELAEIHPGVMLTEELQKKLNTWIFRFYRDRLVPGDLQDSELLQESYAALDELSQIMNLGSIYDFQKTP